MIPMWRLRRRRLSSEVLTAEAIAFEAVLRLKLRQRYKALPLSPAYSHLLDFCQATWPAYQRSPHLELVASALEEVERGENDRLIIEMPPRHGKTQLVSVRFPAWALCRDPTRRIIAASYGERLAGAIGRVVRNLVDTQRVVPHVRLARDQQAKDMWETQQGGMFLAVGIGSGVIGFGGDLITIDDPIKKREEAESQAQRDKHWDWYASEIVTREERGTAVIVVMHRWHEDDLVGRILAEEPGRWKVLKLPALARENDPLGRGLGEALWPWRRTRDELLGLRRRVGERNWASLFQQEPAPEEGNIYRWWPTYRAVPPLQGVLVPIDTAYTDKTDSDYTAWSVWGDDGTRLYLLDCQRVQATAPEAEGELKRYLDTLRQHYSTVPIKPLVRQGVAIDRVVGQHLRQAKVPVVEVKMPAGNTKEEMAKVVSAEFEGGRMLIPAGFAPWLEAWLAEHKSFPNAMHDDWVETTNIAGWYRFRAEPWAYPDHGLRLYGR